MVRQRSAKPLFSGSNPLAASIRKSTNYSYLYLSPFWPLLLDLLPFCCHIKPSVEYMCCKPWLILFLLNSLFDFLVDEVS